MWNAWVMQAMKYRNKWDIANFPREHWVVCKIETAFGKVNRGSRNSENRDDYQFKNQQ